MLNIKEIALKVANDYDKREVYFPYRDDLVNFAEALIESYKAELLKEAGEPVVHMYPDKDGPLAGKCFIGGAQTGDIDLYTSDQLAAAVARATNPLEEKLSWLDYTEKMNKALGVEIEELTAKLAAAQEQQQTTFLQLSHALRIAENQLAKAEQQVAEACSAYMLNKNYNSLEFDRKYSAEEFCAGQKSTVEFLAKMIRSGEWRKFVKEM